MNTEMLNRLSKQLINLDEAAIKGMKDILNEIDDNITLEQLDSINLYVQTLYMNMKSKNMINNEIVKLN